MKTYRVWFNDGSAVLVEARTIRQAHDIAPLLLSPDLRNELEVDRVEELA